MSAQLLLVEDDVELAGLTRQVLENEGYQVDVEHDGGKAVKRILLSQPELVILDIMLPGEDGFSICRRLRPTYRGPVLMLTAKSDTIDQIVGLEIGADDYLTKPFEPRLLLARVRAVLRRVSVETGRGLGNDQQLGNDRLAELEFGDLCISHRQRQVLLRGQVVELTTPEYDLLHLLAVNAGSILSRQEIFRALRGIDYDGLNRGVDINICQLRQKIETDPVDPQRIKTIRNKGYLFVGM